MPSPASTMKAPSSLNSSESLQKRKAPNSRKRFVEINTDLDSRIQGKKPLKLAKTESNRGVQLLAMHKDKKVKEDRFARARKYIQQISSNRASSERQDPPDQSSSRVSPVRSTAGSQQSKASFSSTTSTSRLEINEKKGI